MNNSKNKKLVPGIAEQLILELFAGQTKELNEIIAKVEEIHKQRGGLPHTARIHPVKRALDNLKRDGKTEKPPQVYWKIHAAKENTIKTLDEFIAWAKKFDEGDYVFRGVPNKAYKIQASAYRRPEEDDRNFVNFLHINKDLIRTARQRGYDYRDGSEWNELDILVELQHFRAATCLIDFSFSAQVALWFACQQEQKKEKGGGLVINDNLPHGKVSAVMIKQRKYKEITPELMKGEDEKEEDKKSEDEKGKDEKRIDFFLNDDADPKLYYLQPKFQNNRIISQQSVLLFGNYELEADEECLIEGEHKDEILRELERTSGYTEDRLFPDFEGFAWVNREAATYTATTFQAYKDLGKHAYAIDDFDNALEDLSRAIDFETDDGEVYYLRGMTYVSKNENENALKDLDRAIELKFDSAEVYYNKGYLYQQQGRYSDAIDEYDTAIRKNKDFVETYYRRGQSNYALDQVEEALTDFTEAIQLKPDYFDAYFQRGSVLQELQEYPSALDDYNKAIELNPNKIMLFYHRSQVLYYLERFDEARLDLLTALYLAKQQDNVEMFAYINVRFQDVFGPNTSEDEDE